MSAPVSLDMWPQSLVDKLVYHILKACPELISAFLSAMGKRIHMSTVLAEFTSLSIPDEALCFLDHGLFPYSRPHRVSAVLSNAERYASFVKRIVITDAGLPPPQNEIEDMAGLVNVHDEDSDSDASEGRCRIALQPIPAPFLFNLLAVCSNLETLIWCSTNPPPDGICENIVDSCPRLEEFSFWPTLPLKAVNTAQNLAGKSPSRASIPKWDAPSLPLLYTLPLKSLNVSRLTLPGSRALLQLFSHFGDDCPLQDVGLDFVWIDDTFCEKFVDACRKVKRLRIGTPGTKLTDVGILTLLESCEALEDISLVDVQGRLSRTLWSKIENLPAGLRKFQIVMSENGAHHSWAIDHLQSLYCLPLRSLTHLSIVRTLPPLRFSRSGNCLEYDPHIEEVTALKSISRDVIASIREATALVVLECDWWSWKPDDLKAVLERCIRLEHLKLAFDAPFSKLLTLTAAFTPLTHLLKLCVCVSRQHSPGQIPSIFASDSHDQVAQPLTPAASPVRQRTALPQLTNDFAAQVFCTDDSKLSEGTDPSLPPLRDVKRFARKCPRLIELEWYGRNARGTWLISRPVTTSKINTNVAVEFYRPVAPPEVTARAKLERAAEEAIQLGANLAHNVAREGSTWSSWKCAQLMSERERVEKEAKEESTTVSERLNRIDVKRRTSTATSTDRKSNASASPALSYMPLSPPTSMIPCHDSPQSSPEEDVSSPILHSPSNRGVTLESSSKNTTSRPGTRRTRSSTVPGPAAGSRSNNSSTGEIRSKGQPSSKIRGNGSGEKGRNTNSGAGRVPGNGNRAGSIRAGGNQDNRARGAFRSGKPKAASNGDRVV